MTSNENSVRLEHIFPQIALDAVPQPLWIYGFDGVVAGCNVAAERFWRLPREHSIGKFNAYEHAVTPQGASFRESVRAMRGALAEGTVATCEPILIDLTLVSVAAGVSTTNAYVENTIFPLRDGAGVVRFVAVLQRDVTELVEKRAALDAAQRAHEEQQRTIEELSTPILQVWEGVLTLPVMGAVNERRAAEMMHKLLEEIAQAKAEFAILDLTGVHSVDAATAGYLGRILRAVTLLGARGIVSGISPAVAEALVSLDVDMRDFEMYRDLSDALRRAMHAREGAPARTRGRPARS